MSVTIVVPFYKYNLTNNEIISLKQMKKVFSQRHFTIVCPPTLSNRAKELFSDVSNSLLNFPEMMFKSTRTYNRLLMSRSFFSAFKKYSHILICQLDVYIFKDELDFWCNSNFHFVGAPSFKGYSTDKTYEYGKTLNGGISLRHVSTSLKVLDSIKLRYSPFIYLYKMEYTLKLKLVRLFRDGLLFNYKSPKSMRPIINEDLFWSFIVPQKFNWFKCPTPEQASRFAFDVHPKFLYKKNENKLPMAVHAWWRYDEEFMRDHL